MDCEEDLRDHWHWVALAWEWGLSCRRVSVSVSTLWGSSAVWSALPPDRTEYDEYHTPPPGPFSAPVGGETKLIVR